MNVAERKLDLIREIVGANPEPLIQRVRTVEEELAVLRLVAIGVPREYIDTPEKRWAFLTEWERLAGPKLKEQSA